MTTTTSVKALEYFLRGKDYYYSEQYPLAVEMFEQAVKADTNFLWAIRFLGFSNTNNRNRAEGRKWAAKFQSKRDLMDEVQKMYADYDYANTYETPNESIIALKRLINVDDQPPVRRSLGTKYCNLQQYKNAIPELEKALEMYRAWGIKPLGPDFYFYLGEAYHGTGQYKNEKNLYKRAEHDFPSSRSICLRQIILAISEKDTIKTKKYIEKWISLLNYKPADQAIKADINEINNEIIAGNIGEFYESGGNLDMAEKYYRKAIGLAPGNPEWKSVLARFLIYNDRNINEGIEIAESILDKNPDALIPFRAKGWGLYKRGKYTEALKILEYCWNPHKNGYDHTEYLHLQEVRKAAANKQ